MVCFRYSVDYCRPKIGLQWSTAGGIVLMVTTVGQRLVCSGLLQGCSADGDYCGTKIGMQWSTAGGIVLMVTTVGQRLVCSGLLQGLAWYWRLL